MKKYLKEQIKEIVKQALETGILEPDRIRMISVGPLHGAELMGIWFSNEWDRYEYLDDKEPYAAFSLHEWREELLSREHSVAAGKDQVAAVHQSGPLPLFYPGFADSSLGNTKEGKANHATTSGGQHPIHSLILSALQDLKKDLQESLRELASEKPFSDFSGTVALCEFGLSHSSHPVAIAYCHPDYNGRLYSLMEHRGDEILYPDGCFTEDAIIVFFPEGEDEDEQGEPTSQKYALDAVESYSLQDRRDNEVIFRFRGELTDRRLGPGHHDEDMGWPSSEETGARIIQFFGQKPELRFSPEEFPDPTNSKAVTSWLDRFVRSGSRKGTRLVRQIIEDYGLDGVPVLLDAAAMQDFSDRPKMELTFISELVDAGRYQMALDRIQNLVRQNPHFADDTRESLLHCYIGLERWEDAWSAIQGYRKKLEIPLSELDSKGAENSKGKALPSAMAAFELLLALRLERQSEAIVAQCRKALEEAKSEHERLLQIGLLLWAETENASSATPSGGKGNRDAAQEIVKDLGETLGVSSAQPSVILRRILSSGPVPQLNAFLPILKSQELLEISKEWQQSSRSLETLNLLRKAQNTSAAEKERIEAILADRRTMDYSEVPGHWWMPERTLRTDLKRPFRISLRGETIFGTDDDGLFALNSQSGRLNKYPIPKSRVRSYAFHPQNDSIVYAMDKDRGFIIYDLNEETVKGERASSHWAQFDYIATRGHLLAIGGGVVDFYDISDPLQPEYLTTIGLEYRDAGSFLLEDDRLYLMIARKGLFTLDISALSRAKSDYKLLAHIPWNRGGQYRLERYQNYLLADGGAIVFDLSNSDSPNLIAANDLSLESQAFEMDGSLWAADNDARILFFESGNLAGENRKIQFEHRKELDDESTESLDEADLSKATPQFRASEALAMNDRVLIRQGDDFLLMRRIPSPTSGTSEIINLLSPVREAVVDFVARSLAEYKAEHGSVGGIILGFVPWQRQIELQVYGPMSILATGHRSDLTAQSYSMQPFAQEPKENSDDFQPTESGSSEDRSANAEVDAKFQRIFEGNTSHESFVAAQNWCASLYSEIQKTPAFQDATSGICYFLSLEPRQIVSAHYESDRPHELSWKAPVALSGQDLVVQLEGAHGYEYIEEAQDAADEDSALFGRILQSAAEGHKWSQRVAIQFLDLSKEGPAREEPWREREIAVIESLNRASEIDRLAEFVLGGLRNYAAHPVARSLLEREFASDDSEMSVRAGILLGRAESDEMVQRVREFLGETNDYQAADLADLILKRINERLEELVPDLEGWMERADVMDNRIPQLARHLFRAGVATPPAKLLEQSGREKNDEQYHSKSDSMGFGPDEMEESVAAERLWTSRTFAFHIANLANADDRRNPLWPPELPAEPWPASYRYILEGAKKYLLQPVGSDLRQNWQSIAMQKSGPETKRKAKSKPDTSANIAEAKKTAQKGRGNQEIQTYLDWFYDALIDHALPGKEPRPAIIWLKDRLQEMSDLQQSGKITGQAMLEFVRRIQDAPRDTFEKGYWNRLAEMNKLYSVQCAWDHVARDELSEARILADRLLAEFPRDGQVLFLDARLRWRMESIDACIAKLDSYIEQATDDTGKARLLNLYGCALDEQKRYQESLPYFERAYQLQPEESMYRKNIAEIHEKMGNTDEAKAWSEGRKN